MPRRARSRRRSADGDERNPVFPPSTDSGGFSPLTQARAVTLMTNCPERPTAIGFDLIDAPHPDNDAQRYEITPTHARVEERGPDGVFRQIGGYAHYIDAAAFPTPQDFFAAVRDWIDGLRAGDRFAAREVGDLN